MCYDRELYQGHWLKSWKLRLFVRKGKGSELEASELREGLCSKALGHGVQDPLQAIYVAPAFSPHMVCICSPGGEGFPVLVTGLCHLLFCDSLQSWVSRTLCRLTATHETNLTGAILNIACVFTQKWNWALGERLYETVGGLSVWLGFGPCCFSQTVVRMLL